MSLDFWRLGMSAQMGQNCPTKAFFVAWSKLCFKYYVLWPVCHTYSTSQCLWMTWQWNSWNSHYFVFCSIVPISVSRISMLCHYIVGHCKNMRSKPILSLYWSFSRVFMRLVASYIWMTLSCFRGFALQLINRHWWCLNYRFWIWKLFID